MKKSILLTFGILLSLSVFSQSQDVMVIEKKDNTTLRMGVDDIRRIIFESAYVNPTGVRAEAVDLGLPSGVKWASWNLGASNASDYGGYYGWGDPTGQKTIVSLGEYPSSNPPNEISNTQYDVAKALWGNGWRLPTYDDFKELCDLCSWYKSGDDIKVIGPNGNSIIIPLAGSRMEAEVSECGTMGRYWSGSLIEEDSNYAIFLSINMVEGNYGLSGGIRYWGMSVRPVYGTPMAVTVTTGSATNISASGATISGSVSGVSQPVNVGIIYGTTSNLSSTSGTRKSTTSSGNFSVTLSGLNASTKYYYRAYAEINGTYYYGEIENFTTSDSAPISGFINGHEWVDLGLPSGTKWATCNVGASTPEEYGGYYAWGETQEKKEYAWSTYTHCNGSANTCHNLGSDIAGTQCDVAHVKWGGSWVMPSLDQIKELVSNSSAQWTTKNGVYGMSFTGPNGGTIFLPAVGFRWSDYLRYDGSNGFYWSSTLHPSYSNYAYYLSFNSGLANWLNDDGSRSSGQGVRPVTH